MQEATEQKPFRLIGVRARTSNMEEMVGNGVIGWLWQQFFAIADSIPDQIDPGTTLAVYTDYEFDAEGPYDVYVGRESSLEGEPEFPLLVLDVPPTSAVVVTSGVGELPDVVVSAWQAIWHDEALLARRAYTFDVEVYDQRAADPAAGQVEIRLSVR